MAHQCTQCRTNFDTVKDLALHVVQNHQTHKCGHCGLVCPNWSDLQEHMVDDHANEIVRAMAAGLKSELKVVCGTVN